MNLLENFQVEAVLCNNTSGLKPGQTPHHCEGKLIKGRWTAVYDQALNIELENGERFLANLRYNLKHSIAQDPLLAAQQDHGISEFSTIETSDYDKFDSDCGRTMVGFVQNIPSITGKSHTFAQHTVKCFHGFQVKKYNYETSEEHNGKLKWSTVSKHNSHVQVENLMAEDEAESTANLAKTANKTQHGPGEKN